MNDASNGNTPLQKTLNSRQSFLPLLQWVIVPFFVGLLIIPYLQVELATNWNTTLVEEFSQICVKQSPTLRYVKILTLDNQNQTSTIYCSFKPRQNNVILELAKYQGKWQLTRSQSANLLFTWPIYL